MRRFEYTVEGRDLQLPEADAEIIIPQDDRRLGKARRRRIPSYQRQNVGLRPWLGWGGIES